MQYKLARKANLFIFALGLWGCATNTEFLNTSDRDNLIELQRQQQRAHLNYDAELLTSMFNEHIIQLKNGRIAQRSKQENIARIKSYFESVKFLEWEDIDPPKIRISKDGTMAYLSGVLTRLTITHPLNHNNRMN